MPCSSPRTPASSDNASGEERGCPQDLLTSGEPRSHISNRRTARIVKKPEGSLRLHKSQPLALNLSQKDLIKMSLSPAAWVTHYTHQPVGKLLTTRTWVRVYCVLHRCDDPHPKVSKSCPLALLSAVYQIARCHTTLAFRQQEVEPLFPFPTRLPPSHIQASQCGARHSSKPRHRIM
jgi:hypothetical protein